MPPSQSLRSASRAEQARFASRLRVLRSAGASSLLKVVSPAKVHAKQARGVATKRSNGNKLIPANRTKVAVIKQAIAAKLTPVKHEKFTIPDPTAMVKPLPVKPGKGSVASPMDMGNSASIKGGEAAIMGLADMANLISVKGIESLVTGLADVIKPVPAIALGEHDTKKINKIAGIRAIAVSAAKAIDTVVKPEPYKPVKPKRTTMTIKTAKENLKNMIPEIKSTRHSLAPLYGKYWLRETTGATMLAYHADIPKTGYRGIPTLVRKAHIRSGDEIIAENEHFEEWTRIPSREHVDKALKLVAGDDNIFEYIIHSREYVESLHKMESWLVEVVMKKNRYLAENLLAVLRTKPDLHAHLFRQLTHEDDTVLMSDLFTLCREEWLNDAIINRVQRLFEFWYGQNGRYHFIWYSADRGKHENPPTFTNVDGPGKADGQKKVDGPKKVDRPKKAGGPEKVFVIVDMNAHWGVVEMDFKNHTIRSADSLDWGVTAETIDGLVNWLMPDVHQRQLWAAAKATIGSLPIQKQVDSSSCGLYALLAVEWAVNPFVDRSFVNPSDLRIRFLGHASGIFLPHHDLIPVQLWEQVEGTRPLLDDLGLMVLENYAVIHGVLEEYGAWFKGFDDLHPPDIINPEDEAEYDRVSKEIEEEEKARKAAASQLSGRTVKEDQPSMAYGRPDTKDINNGSSKSTYPNAATNVSRANVAPVPASVQYPDRPRTLYDGFVSANEDEYSDAEPPSPATRSALIKPSSPDLRSDPVLVPSLATCPPSAANPLHVARSTSAHPVIAAKPVLRNIKTHCAQANCLKSVCIEDPEYEAKLEDPSKQAQFDEGSWRPLKDTVFKGRDEFRTLLDRYAEQRGFKIRTLRSNDKKTEYVCSREGRYNPKPAKKVAAQRRSSAGSKRIGCGFKINLRDKTPRKCSVLCSPSACSNGHRRQIWVVSMVKLQHNHELEKPELQFTSLTTDMKALLNNVVLSTAKTSANVLCRMLQATYNVRIDPIQVKNHLQHTRAKSGSAFVGNQDAQEVDRLLSMEKAASPKWSYERCLDNENRLQRIFWMSPKMKELYSRFHDVIV
ncbi:hypothetical protein CPC16_003626, partial [Podila verticillata]